MSQLPKIADRLYKRYVVNQGMVDEAISKLKLLKIQLKDNPSLEGEVLKKMSLIEADLSKYKKEFRDIKKEWNKANVAHQFSGLEEDYS